MSTCQTPVAFIIFNRPDLTQIVFDAIAKARPSRLLVVADGPRSPEEAENCRQARAIIEQVDWECEVLTNYSEINLGCRKRVSTGIDWVFSEVEEAIILEDDCLPAPSFFTYCEELLRKYSDDERIMAISGDCFYPQDDYPYSYFFSRYPHIWGWATWRRAWKLYDVDIKDWPQAKASGFLSRTFEYYAERLYWKRELDNVFERGFDTWDYQWNYCCWSNGGLSITPAKNMVSNLGFRADATHTLTRTLYAEYPIHELDSIIYPPIVTRNIRADQYFFKVVNGGNKFIRFLITEKTVSVLRPMKRILKRLLKRH